MTPRLPASARAWGSVAFPEVFKREVEALDPVLLPLVEALAQGNAVADEPVTVLVRRTQPCEGGFLVVADVLYASLVAGCSCADDPTPVPTAPESCQLHFRVALPDGAFTAELA